MQPFDFIFSMHIIGVTNLLSLALERKYHDIENAMRLIGLSKRRMQIMTQRIGLLLNEAFLFVINLKLMSKL